ncbi:MAG: hypothetical protein EON58_09035 [Alphaproteobacteria bacterium]|nr:MAG: hypothetical protein EON58_09035 [Alphaproteobacteria bacterium]
MSKGHLTLVDNETGTPGPVSPRRLSTDHDGQFQLELKGGDTRYIFIIVMDEVHGLRLSTAVDKLHPITVVDLRQTLRFDQPGSSRTAFFEQLSRIRSTYLRAPIEWPHIQTRHLATNQSLPARVYHETVERWEGPIALLVSKVEHGRYLEAVLNRVLSEHRPGGWEIEQVA